jgi:hypothetical protein
MRQKRLILAGLAVLLVLGIVAPMAWADDDNPPPWQRGGPRTTFERWEFDTANLNPLPDAMYNPYGTPSTTVTPLGSWLPIYDNRFGVWPLSGMIDIDIPNDPTNPDWQKNIWVQLTWDGEGITVPEVSANGVPAQWIESDPRLPGGWFHSTYLVVLPYNPPMEHLHVAGDIRVDELVVDTICIPEPSTLVLLGAGAFGLVVFAWRKRAA